MFYIVILIFFKLLVQSLPLSYVENKQTNKKNIKIRKVHYRPCCLGWRGSLFFQLFFSSSLLFFQRGHFLFTPRNRRRVGAAAAFAAAPTRPWTLYSAGWRSRNLNCRSLSLLLLALKFSEFLHLKIYFFYIASPPPLLLELGYFGVFVYMLSRL